MHDRRKAQYFSIWFFPCLNVFIFLLLKTFVSWSDQDFLSKRFPIKIYKYPTSQTNERNPNLKWQDDCVHLHHRCQSNLVQQHHGANNMIRFFSVYLLNKLSWMISQVETMVPRWILSLRIINWTTAYLLVYPCKNSFFWFESSRI